MIQINEKKDCCGCGACFNACPAKCISMEYDEEGFQFPKVDKNKCVDCNICEKVCPILTNNNMCDDYTEGYAAINKNDQMRLKSSSGGIFSLLANEIISLGGLVVGVAMSSDCRKAQHKIIDSKESLNSLLGSKYLQSDVGDIYQRIKKELINNRLVLFSGTPCQVSALHNYLGKKYENLICIDLICHGVPSPGLWEKNVEYIENRTNSTLLGVNFRCKKEQITAEYGIHYKNACYQPKDEDPYFRMFLKEYSLRLCCYDCKFKGISRSSDITLGDFWGINDFYPDMDDGKGVSLIVIQSTKGKQLFERIKIYLETKQVDINRVFETHNDAMIKSSVKPSDRKEFWNDYQALSYDALFKKYVPLNSKEKVKKILRKFGLLKIVRKAKFARGGVTSNSFGILYIIKK